jgi:NAD(P)-dependent dehydrogenase (short-subunit alcohol dehydrogenase family)
MTQKQQFENHRELSEKRIVVLGGSSGIGLAVAQQVVARGARAIIASSNADRVKQAVERSMEKRKGTRSISRMSATFKTSFRRSVISIIWSSLPGTRCN